MSMINLKYPENYKKIIYITEAELFKHKRKLYPKTLNNMGHGYSQFQDDNIRIAILRQVKDIILRRKGLKGEALKPNSEVLLEAIEDSIKLLSLNLRENQDKVTIEEVDKKDPFSHNEKLDGVYKIATKL